MALDDNQLAALLQASIDFARQLLAEEGGFTPFGAQIRPDGELEFVQVTAQGEASLADLYEQIGARLAIEAREGAILGAALVANAKAQGAAAGTDTALLVTIEAPGFARSITVPYRLAPVGDCPQSVELGQMIPEESAAVLFPVLN